MQKFLWALTLFAMAVAPPPAAQAAEGAAKADAAKKVAPYVPSATRVVDQMLELAKVGPGDYVIDLGAGDGQIVIAAAGRGALGHGVDLDGNLVQRSRVNASDKGVSEQTVFLQDDIFATDFSKASVVTIYLMPAANARLRPLLLERLAPGTRVVSNAFDMREWQPDGYEVGAAGSGVYLWVIPAQAAGEWRFKADGKAWQLDLEQQFQEIEPELQQAGERLQVIKALLRGRNLQLIAKTEQQRYAFHGRIDGDTIDGLVQIRDANGDRVEHWSATRTGAKTAAR